MTDRDIVRVTGLSKTFPGTRALSDVALAVRAGEVHALVGHNGSGKSTLIKVLAGYHHPDPGALITIDGHEVSAEDLGQSGRHKSKLSFLHQDLGLVLELNTIDNLALRGGFARHRLGGVRWSEQAERARQTLSQFDLDLDLTVPLAKVTPVERTIVALAGALQGWSSDGGVLVLDEPTAVLPPNEVGRLLDIIRRLRNGGAGILYVSHRLDEVFELADRVTVLRNGLLVTTRDVAGLGKQELVELMLGSEARADYRADIPAADQTTSLLEVRHLSGRYLRDVSITVNAGEVLGVAGLPADGRDELPRLITDAAGEATSGEVRTPATGGRWVPLATWRGTGVALVPPDRGKIGVLTAFSVGENLSLSSLSQFATLGKLSRRGERGFVRRWIDRLGVKTAGADAPIATLSGGNQQKVLLGRALGTEPKVLVMCEPTAGVDVGARQSIYELVAEQVRSNGLAAVVASSDVSDLQAICTRVVVLHEGRIVRELEGELLNEVELLHAMEGLAHEEVG